MDCDVCRQWTFISIFDTFGKIFPQLVTFHEATIAFLFRCDDRNPVGQKDLNKTQNVKLNQYLPKKNRYNNNSIESRGAENKKKEKKIETQNDV